MNTYIETALESVKDMTLTNEDEMLLECTISQFVFKQCEPSAEQIKSWKHSIDGKKCFKLFVISKLGHPLSRDVLDAMYRYYVIGKLYSRNEENYKKIKLPCKCSVCGSSEVTVDHKIPIAWGGNNEVENLHYLCKTHNSMKNARIAFIPLFAA